jgi:hypothetical protein
MAGAYCKPWCIYCRRSPGLDCTDAARPTKWRRQIERNQLRRYLITMEDDMLEENRDLPEDRTQRRRLAEEQGYSAVIRPWRGGWEIFGINGPGVTDGATQACTIDEVLPMVRDYVDCTIDVSGEDDWETDYIPVRLVLDLDVDCHTDTRTASMEVSLGAHREPVVLVEQITYWCESPEAE